ncbi:hypothetical protein H8356DRAFT_273304 [Neocallimastix lanati (nom. inval.)]|uniref:Uncharacterized protein n=1 Tax=Neocallimastix californiae TaxID=1754190 RepID=A0A1Y2AEQ8_9FUNG|nr:hypothetical protein H8356DRAFT_273304 [Neocallimastix sp. JGI-2020a]ORY20770.1 hypothetical protein LY90DRAFT_516525 [Neocallimastix californiae]|eukprot:ORY20770.1 hypothetical protein LY90DRAFT_516525 [Neocallimastix californiae]
MNIKENYKNIIILDQKNDLRKSTNIKKNHIIERNTNKLDKNNKKGDIYGIKILDQDQNNIRKNSVLSIKSNENNEKNDRYDKILSDRNIYLDIKPKIILDPNKILEKNDQIEKKTLHKKDQNISTRISNPINKELNTTNSIIVNETRKSNEENIYLNKDSKIINNIENKIEFNNSTVNKNRLISKEYNENNTIQKGITRNYKTKSEEKNKTDNKIKLSSLPTKKNKIQNKNNLLINENNYYIIQINKQQQFEHQILEIKLNGKVVNEQPLNDFNFAGVYL